MPFVYELALSGAATEAACVSSIAAVLRLYAVTFSSTTYVARSALTAALLRPFKTKNQTTDQKACGKK